jgi:hypothetical protein
MPRKQSNKAKPELDTDFFKHLVTDEVLEEITDGKMKAVTTRSSRSRGTWLGQLSR